MMQSRVVATLMNNVANRAVHGKVVNPTVVVEVDGVLRDVAGVRATFEPGRGLVVVLETGA